jgi:nucleoside-diphosphate-sugar epimerase
VPYRSLVTGGAGYFGRLLVDKLTQQGHTVRVFDLNEVDDPGPELEAIRGDIRDADAVRKACSGMDLVFHNVAQVPLAKDRALFRSVNIDGTRILLSACLETGIRKVVHTSTSAVYGVPKQNPVNEQTPPTPMEAYGRAKLEGEALCAEFGRKGLDYSIIRPRTIMGHGRLGIFQILFEWIHEGRNVPVFNGGHNVYQFVHADDLADACILAGLRAGIAEYNCGTDRFGTLRETLEALCRHAATGSKVTSLPMWPAVAGMKVASTLGLSPLGAYHALMYGRSLYFDSSKARNELGWRPKYSNQEMFVDSYEWYLRNRRAVLTAKSGASHHRSAVKQGLLSLVKRVL